MNTNVVAGNTYTFSTCSSGNFDTELTLYQGAGSTPLAYNDDFCGVRSEITWEATFTGTLRVLIDRYSCQNSGGSRTTTLTITCALPPPTPSNDDPCGAISLTVGSSCSGTSTTNAGGTATTGISDPSCSVYGNDDVWYSFVAPASGNIGLETTANGMDNGAMALYSAGSCSGTFTELECDDDDGTGSMPAIYYSGLTPGNTYYVRFWGILGESGTFDICAYDPADCKYTLHMYDLGGDGWDGATVSISINAGTPVNYTLASGERGEASFDVSIGDNVSLSYTAGSGDESEISYILALGDGYFFNDGPNPATGVVFSHTSDCVKPSAPVEDCIGGMTLCNAQTINVDPMNEGITTDLNSTNRGCLGSNERQGQWYNFRPSSGGTVEMDIIPMDSSDDYDFAVWGPYTELTCVPPAAPIRCSYSGDTGTTGMQIGSGDTSEGSGGDKFVDELTVSAGEVYVLYVSNWSRTGIASDINFTLSGGAALDCTVLPIELLDFSGTTDDTQVVLKWTTSTETDNEKFILERSRDAMNFDPIAIIPGAGNSIVTIDYEHTDHQPYLGVNYYRLRQVDYNGDESTSQVISVVFDNTIAAVSSIYPNPATDRIAFNVQSLDDGPITARIFDASGRLVMSSVIQVAEGMQRIDLPLHGLQRGSYSMELSGMDDVGIPSGRFLVR